MAAVCLDGFEGQVLEFGEQAAEFFALSNSGWYSASSEGDRRRVTVLPAIFWGQAFGGAAGVVFLAGVPGGEDALVVHGAGAARTSPAPAAPP